MSEPAPRMSATRKLAPWVQLLPDVPSPSSERSFLTQQVKSLALQCGLQVSAVTTADAFPELFSFVSQQIDRGYLAGMPWFDHQRAEVIADPSRLHANAKSILTVGVHYWRNDLIKPADGVKRGRISRYAWGDDYHRVLKKRMLEFLSQLETLVGSAIEARCLVDTARISDRAVAARAGLGWYGKHSCLIVPGMGSGVLLGEILLDLELEPDRPLVRDCGRCRICLDSCPTGAIVSEYHVDSRLCISFQTIEQRGAVPRSLRPAMGDWVFGCDVCQEVCPYTLADRHPPDPALTTDETDRAFPRLHWLVSISESEFRSYFSGTAVLRAKRRGLARNAAIALGNIGDESDLPSLRNAMESHDEPMVREHAAWAIGRIGGEDATKVLERSLQSEAVSSVVQEIELSLVSLGR